MKEHYDVGIGVFESEADHLIDLVRRHAPLEQVLAAGCPACGAALTVAFAEDGTEFSIGCAGALLHIAPSVGVASPPPWWRACVVVPTDQTWYVQSSHTFDAAGNLFMPTAGWQADGVRWSGGFGCPVGHPDHAFWRWVLSESGCTSNLIEKGELAELRARYETHVGR